MRTGQLITLSALGLSACATVVDETRTSIMVDGRAYELRTRTLEGTDGTFQQSSVVVRNRLYTCLPASPGDCEATVRLARTESRGDD